MTIEQANQYFAALPDGFASTEQLRAAFTAPVQKVPRWTRACWL